MSLPAQYMATWYLPGPDRRHMTAHADKKGPVSPPHFAPGANAWSWPSWIHPPALSLASSPSSITKLCHQSFHLPPSGTQHAFKMPETSTVQQQAPMEIPMESGVVTQQPVRPPLSHQPRLPHPIHPLTTKWSLTFCAVQSADAQPPMDTEMGLRGGCGESLDCCGVTESCGCC